MARLKTGTPPRLDGRTINWAQLDEQPSDSGDWTCSTWNDRRTVPQIFCAITRTNAATHAIIADNLHRSPLFTGAIGAAGPRYCPSIEDKIHRFADRDGHQVFLEPEGRSEEHTSELQSLMRISYAVFCLKKKKRHTQSKTTNKTHH